MADVQFDIGDSCVCLHTGNNPYEAKVIDKKDFQGKQCYIVHFKGWNSRYDQKIPIGEHSTKMFKCTLEEYQNDHQGEPSEPKAKKRGARAVAEDAQPESSSKPAKKAAKIVAPETATRAAAEDAQPESSSKPAKKTVKIVALEIATEPVNGEQHHNDHQGEPSEPKAKKRGVRAVAEDAQPETGSKRAKKVAKIVAPDTATTAAAKDAQPENSSKPTKKAAKTMAPEAAAEQVNEGASSVSRSSKRKPAVETKSKPDSKVSSVHSFSFTMRIPPHGLGYVNLGQTGSTNWFIREFREDVVYFGVQFGFYHINDIFLRRLWSLRSQNTQCLCVLGWYQIFHSRNMLSNLKKVSK
ncbi:Protein CBG23258 [Caenorhabditis briggsae]|uniref:Protein CBG23258 n=1 Tax=Caenorhabditis briggsae TaxID=6238 RepID=A8Y4C3_CAEBR|nr:Protein CBG23258 [Caenorhabditis briggsae]CAP39743.2 Protein CBG23258 [Caenorhabditis briggsae]